MLSIVFGLIAISMGFWVLMKFWWYMVDVLIALLPLLLIGGGGIALLAGIKNTGMRTAFLSKKSAATGRDTAAQKKGQ